MSRIKICLMLTVLLIGCVGRPISRPPDETGQNSKANASSILSNKTERQSSQEPQGQSGTGLRSGDNATSFHEMNGQSAGMERDPQPKNNQVRQNISVSRKDDEFSNSKQLSLQEKVSLKKTLSSSKKNDMSKANQNATQTKQRTQEIQGEFQEEAERDIMEEALVLLNESHTYWVNGDLEDALDMLDQAYALLIDTNGNPDIARQKDDLRLMISKRILSIYNSIQATAKGKRSEIPVINNADVEKEIRQFQTVEREFFVSSYHRSAMYRPIILRELKKAGLPEELAWLPLVESGFKISALSSARALGLWQFIPSTGYKYGLNRDDWVDERMDIEKSTRAAIDYLKELHNMFGDWLTVLAAYNCGEGRVIRTIASQHINYLDRFWDLYQRLPYETARYVPRFLATILVIRDPKQYGIDLGEGKGAPLSYEIVEINRSVRLQDVAQKIDVSEEILNILNAELRHRITPDKPYKLKVPVETAQLVMKVIDDIPEAEIRRVSSKRGAVIRHRVKAGETLASIADKYKTSVGLIVSNNNLSKKKRLVVGQRLNVPIKTARVAVPTTKTKKSEGISRSHKVQKGDTLSSLAMKYDTTAEKLRVANQLKNNQLKIGQIIRVEASSEEQNRREQREVGQKKERKEKTTGRSVKDKDVESKAVKKYTVKKGDSLNKIARENNLSLDKLLDLNGLKNKDSIHPGQVILLK